MHMFHHHHTLIWLVTEQYTSWSYHTHNITWYCWLHLLSLCVWEVLGKWWCGRSCEQCGEFSWSPHNNNRTTPNTRLGLNAIPPPSPPPLSQNTYLSFTVWLAYMSCSAHAWVVERVKRAAGKAGVLQQAAAVFLSRLSSFSSSSFSFVSLFQGNKNGGRAGKRPR